MKVNDKVIFIGSFNEEALLTLVVGQTYVVTNVDGDMIQVEGSDEMFDRSLFLTTEPLPIITESTPNPILLDTEETV